MNIQHVSSAETVAVIRAMKQINPCIHAEVTPQHFSFTEDLVLEKGALAKVNPPLRTKRDRQALLEGLKDGTLDLIVTDHAPHAREEKDKGIEKAPSGMIGLETSLPLMLTNMVRTGEISWSRLVEVMAVNPRRVLRLADVKIEKGSKADLTLIDPEKEITVTEDYFESKSKNSAFLGETLMGVASDVFVDGKRTLANGVVAQ